MEYLYNATRKTPGKAHIRNEKTGKKWCKVENGGTVVEPVPFGWQFKSVCKTCSNMRVREQQNIYAPDKATLRDQFAMAALTGIIHQYAGVNQSDDSPVFQFTATIAYKYADAMLEARKK